jgi:2-oxo-4-hydroxy-4-carboxy-5-ureidoimidazoline decarboxylase
MIALHDFNHLPHEKALALIHPCVALPAGPMRWFAGLRQPGRIVQYGKALTQNWDEAALAQALSAHPRIGENPRVHRRRRRCRARSRAR